MAQGWRIENPPGNQPFDSMERVLSRRLNPYSTSYVILNTCCLFSRLSITPDATDISNSGSPLDPGQARHCNLGYCRLENRCSRSFSVDERGFEHADDILGRAHGGTHGCETNVKGSKCVDTWNHAYEAIQMGSQCFVLDFTTPSSNFLCLHPNPMV
jgi:hypothetical protein